MKRLTTDNPKDNIQAALNLFYIKDGWTWVRGGGPAPEHPDVSLCDYVRRIMATHVPYVDLDMDDDSLSMMLGEWLFDDPESMEGLIAVLYTTAWAFAELRHRLAAYEDTGLEPEAVEATKTAMMGKAIAEIKEFEGVPIDRLRELAQAEKDGRLVELPFVAMVEQSLQNGKMTPQKDQRFNGRYAVVYMDKKKWKSPLIDICGRHYDREQAEFRRSELTREEAEAALKGGAE